MTSTDEPFKSPAVSPHPSRIAVSRSHARAADRDVLETWQLEKLNALLATMTEHPLYRSRLRAINLPLRSIRDLSGLPLLTKSELTGEHRDAESKLFTLPQKEYVRFHQTSGSRGWPMPVFDTRSDWRWWIECWQFVLDAADVTSSDVAMMAFSFGPFIGFWSAHDAFVDRGVLVVPGGGLTSIARLRLIESRRCTVLCCTPTYALHLAEVADQHGIDLQQNAVSRIIVAGEPGGSIPDVRAAIESTWDARVIDHAGASEIGAWGFASGDDSGLHVIESEFIAEFLVFDPESPLDDPTFIPANPGQRAELVITNLGRYGGPVLRYRTGDIVTPVWDHEMDCRFVHLPGGVLGRSDDMMVIRGVNVFPASIEAIVREIDPTAEFRMIATRHESMDQLRIEIESETPSVIVSALEERLRERLSLRIPVTPVPPGTLPRSEAKSKRYVDQRTSAFRAETSVPNASGWKA